MSKKLLRGLVGGLVLILFLNLVVKPLLNEDKKKRAESKKAKEEKIHKQVEDFAKKVEQGEIVLKTEDISSSQKKLGNETKLSSNEIFRCIFTDTISNLDKPYTVSINILNETGMGSGTGKYQLEVSNNLKKYKEYAFFNKSSELKWFDLVDNTLILNSILVSNNIKHENFNIELNLTEIEKYKKLFDATLVAKQDFENNIIGVNSYVIAEERFFYSANAQFKNNNKVTKIFENQCLKN